METPVETRLATIVRTGVDQVEVRFKNGAVIDVLGIAEIMFERQRMCGDTDVGILAVVPPDADLDVAVINVDHYQVNRSADHVLALAMVAGGLLAETLINLYNAYYPPRFPSRVFLDENEARTWLEREIASRL